MEEWKCEFWYGVEEVNDACEKRPWIRTLWIIWCIIMLPYQTVATTVLLPLTLVGLGAWMYIHDLKRAWDTNEFFRREIKEIWTTLVGTFFHAAGVFAATTSYLEQPIKLMKIEVE